MDKVLKELEESLIDAYDYLSEYANEYLEEDSKKRIIENAVKEWESYRQLTWKAIYDIIQDNDNSPEYEAWYIAWLKEAITLINKYN